MIRGVVFDLGNTLMYFDGDWQAMSDRGAQAMRDYLLARGYPTPNVFTAEWERARTIGRDRADTTNIEYTAERALSDALTRSGVCSVPDGLLPTVLLEYFKHEEAAWRAYDDARETLETLRARGLKLALLANASDHLFIERISRQAHVAEYLDPFLTSAKLTHRKPDPRAWQPILEAWKIPVQDIVMVGDLASFDVLGAHRVGMKAILIEERWATPPVAHGEFADADKMEPDTLIRQLSDLPDAIIKLDAQS